MKAQALMAALLLATGLSAGCVSTYQPGLERAPQMSLEEAKTVVRTYANGQYTFHVDGGGDWHRKHTERLETGWAGLHFTYDDASVHSCRFDKVTVKADNNYIGWSVYLHGCPKKSEFVGVRFGEKEEAKARTFSDAVYLLKQDYLARIAPETPQQQAAFDAVVKQYRATQPPPALPEAAVRYKAQAEFAVQQKRFDDAVDLYGKALEVAPWWAAGRYNRGLLLGELEAYNEGIRELQKYLKLEPESPNAKAVQTKIYQWESLAPQGASSTPAAAGSTSKEVQPCRTAFGCVSQ